MNHSPVADPSVPYRRPVKRRIVALGLGVSGLAMILASAWMPWYHFSRSPFSAMPGCDLPAFWPILWWAASLTGLALVGLAVHNTLMGVSTAVASLVVLIYLGLGTGLLASQTSCESSVTVPAYGLYVAFSGATLATAATLADWWWNRPVGSVLRSVRPLRQEDPTRR